MTSRYVLPVLPVVGCLMALPVVFLPRRARATAALALGALIATGAAGDAAAATAERRLLAAVAPSLEPRVESSRGVTLVVVALPERLLGPRRQWELVARLSAGWPVASGRRLWAYREGGGPALPYTEEAHRVLGPRSHCRRPGRLNKDVRGLERKGRVGEVWWVEFADDGRATIEPYCRGADPP